MMDDKVDCIVIGAGVVGLATGRALALAGREVVVLEAAAAIGTGTSSRNSEVIHAGLYYPTGSLKARLCVQGRDMLYDYCTTHNVPHRRCGKLIVAATAQQAAQLQDIARQARANGVTDLLPLSSSQARELEPALACHAALLSPSTGIVDSHALMLALLGDMENAGGMLALLSPLESAATTPEGLRLRTADGTTLLARTVINAAGLHAPQVAACIAGLDAAHMPTARFAKGNYFTLSGKAPFSRLVYPVPEAAGLGIHLTLDLGGQARFGPDVQWVNDPLHLTVDPARSAAFEAAIRTYWPGLPPGSLQPGYAGIRPKITGPGEPGADFIIQDASTHGVPGLVNLFGIESPGLTSCLAIAQEVLRRVQHHCP